MNGASEKKSAYLRRHLALARHGRFVALLSCLVVVATAVMLMLPAVSATQVDMVGTSSERVETQVAAEETASKTDDAGDAADAESKQSEKAAAEAKAEKASKEEAAGAEAAADDSGERAEASEGGDLPGSKAASEDGEPADEQVSESGDPSASSDASGEGASEDGAAASSASASSVGTTEAGSSSDMPAQSFKADLKDKGGKVTLTVEVEAPEGAFPAGTFMKIDGVDARDIQDAVGKAVSKKADGKVAQIQAVDIAFHKGDAKGEEIEPARDITVKLTSALIAETTAPLVVHVDDKGKAEVVDTLTKKQMKKRDLKAEDDQLFFDADEFSTYGIVVMTIEQTLEASDGNAYTVTVTAPADAGVPEGAELAVAEIPESSGDWSCYAEQASEALGVDGLRYSRFFDISIVKDGQKIQPSEPVSVSIRLDDAGEIDGGLKAIHFGSDGPEVLDASMQDNAVSFDASGFSVYAVVGDGSTVNESRMTLNFYGKDQADPIATVYVKNDDDSEGELEQIIYDPGVGVLDSNELFKGWILDAPDYTVDDVASKMDIAEIRAWAKAKANADEIEEGEVHNFYAMIYKTFSVAFKDEDGATIHSEALIFKSSDGSVDYTINQPYTPKYQDEAFQGWYWTNADNAVTDPLVAKDGSEAPFVNGTEVTIKDNITFTVNVPRGYWLSFAENGEGASYTPPQFVQTGNTPEEPAAPTRYGYTFGGWYANEECTGDPFYFGQELTGRTTLYAKWTPKATSPYTIVIWKQNVNGETYDFEESISLNGATNTIVDTVSSQGAGNSAYARVNGVNKTYSGFHLKEFDQNVTITPEGNAVVNIYYNRNAYTLRFYYARSYDVTTGGTTTYTYTPVATTNANGAITWNSGYSYSNIETYYRDTNGNRAYYKTSSDGWFSTSQNSNLTWYRINNGTIYIRQAVTSGGTTRTYLQVNCNDEGFLQSGTSNLYNSLTKIATNDYGFYGGGNTWKDVNSASLNGDALALVSSDYLSKPEVTAGSETIGNYNTYVITSTNERPSSASSVSMTYYYFDVAVYYGQSLQDVWPVPSSTYNNQVVSSLNSYVPNSGQPGNGVGETVRAIHQGSWATGKGISGLYSTLESELFTSGSDTAYFITYWRYQTPLEYTYNVYFSTLEGETADATYKGKGYVLQSDKSFTTLSGEPWQTSGMQTDSGAGYDIGIVTFDGTTVAGRVDVNNGTINVYYDREIYNINYNDGSYVNGNDVELQNKSDDEAFKHVPIVYEEDVTSYNEGGSNYFTPDAPEGYVFDGWYMDTACLQPYTFTTMPRGDINVYAKWIQKQYRVFLHPNVPTEDTSLDLGGQSTSFRVDYGEKIAGGNTINGTRDDYDLIGWYTDAACTKAFNFDAYVLNDTTVTTDYDKTEDTERDKYGNSTATGNKDKDPNLDGDTSDERFWITKKLDLYAKWRARLDGANGINVVYDAGDGTNAPEDPLQYLDNSEATAGAASTPNSADEQFMYWVVQTWDAGRQKYVDDENSVKVYPGDIYTVLKDDAKVLVTEWVNPDDDDDVITVASPASGATPPDSTHTKIKTASYTVQLRAVYGPKSAPTPTHIWWFPNDVAVGTSHAATKADNALQINEAVDIPGAPTREGYKFLGWARTDSTTSGSSQSGTGMPTANALALTEDDLFLTYHEADGDSAAYYTAVIGDESQVVSQVAADEQRPYHDMYAVWQKVNTVTVKKIVKGAIEEGKTFAFTPSATLGGEEFSLGHGGSEVFDGIISGTKVAVTETVDAGYLLESVAYKADGADENVAPTPIKNGAEIAVNDDITITFTNKRKAFPVAFTKTDLGGNKLAGASFTLTVNNGSSYVNYPDEEGAQLTLGTATVDLPAGSYKLKENSAPAGYLVTASDTLFEVDAYGAVTITSCGEVPAEEPGAAAIKLAEATKGSSDTYTVTLRNQPGKPLPSTGGIGTLPLTLFGIALVVGAAAFLVARRRPLAAFSRELAYLNARRVMGRRVCAHKGFTRIVSSRRMGQGNPFGGTVRKR